MTNQRDFEVFEVEAEVSGGRGKAIFLRAYTTFDKRLVAGLKAHTNASFRKDSNGRGYWTTAADSRYADKFRELIAAADQRANGGAASGLPGHRGITTAEKAADFDRVFNEGGEGYNPYR